MIRRSVVVGVLVGGCASPAPPSVLPSKAAGRPVCRATIEVGPTNVHVASGWRDAAIHLDMLVPTATTPEAETREVLCHFACERPPPYYVRTQMIPFRWPVNAVAPLSRGRVAVIPLGTVGKGHCQNGKGDVNNTIEGVMSGDVVVFHEEVQPVAFVREGECEERGVLEHVHRVIDPELGRQVLVKTKETVKVTVSGRTVWIEGDGCDETRMLDHGGL